jgi:hypothetical protein
MATFQGQAAAKIAYKDAPIGKLADTLVCFMFHLEFLVLRESMYTDWSISGWREMSLIIAGSRSCSRLRVGCRLGQ